MIKLAFDFHSRQASDLEQLNRILSTMPLQELDLEDPEGYLAVTKDRYGNMVHQRYGLDTGTLVCRLAENGRGDIYRIDSVVVDKSVDPEDYLDCWRSSNPDRAMRTVITLGFDRAYAFLILHHKAA